MQPVTIITQITSRFYTLQEVRAIKTSGTGVRPGDRGPRKGCRSPHPNHNAASSQYHQRSTWHEVSHSHPEPYAPRVATNVTNASFLVSNVPSLAVCKVIYRACLAASARLTRPTRRLTTEPEAAVIGRRGFFVPGVLSLGERLRVLPPLS